MPKLQQSRSKSAYRTFIGYTAKIAAFYMGAAISDINDIQDAVNEARIAIEDTRTEMFDAVLFSSTRNIDLWITRFNERVEWTLDKIKEALEEQFQRKMNDEEEQFKAAAAAFGTDPATYAQFLTLFHNHSISKIANLQERKTSFANLQDVINVYGKIATFVKNVRFDGRFYHVEVAGSDLARRRSRRKSRQKKSKKTLRF